MTLCDRHFVPWLDLRQEQVAELSRCGGVQEVLHVVSPHVDALIDLIGRELHADVPPLPVVQDLADQDLGGLAPSIAQGWIEGLSRHRNRHCRHEFVSDVRGRHRCNFCMIIGRGHFNHIGTN